MTKALQLALGVLTAIGGFFDVGNLVTAAQAGASFRFALLWSLALGTVIVIVLVEMSGRFAAMSGKALPEAVREHLGVRVWSVPFVVLVLLHLMTLAAEIGGIAFALQLLSGVAWQLCVLPVGLLLWLFLWRATFNAIEYSTASLGLLTLCFVVAAYQLHPPAGDVLRGVLPSLPPDHPARYWLYGVSIIGALIAPFLFYFYSSGAVEDRWDRSYLGVNRVVAIVGMSFGAIITAGLLVVAGIVLHPRHIAVDSIEQAAIVLTDVFPFWGYALFAVSMGIACLGAALEVALSLAYTVSQTFGWHWGQDLDPADDARFSTTYTAAILLASIVVLVSMDPLRLTILAMVLNAMMLPVVSIPFLLLMNDGHILRGQTNGVLGNAAVVGIVALSAVLFVVSIPLVILGG
jgi:Mn2+/Fe2+ NRAMP family transporter